MDSQHDASPDHDQSLPSQTVHQMTSENRRPKGSNNRIQRRTLLYTKQIVVELLAPVSGYESFQNTKVGKPQNCHEMNNEMQVSNMQTTDHLPHRGY